MRDPISLVLGAGSSCAYGFPVGLELRRLILAQGAEEIAAALDEADSQSKVKRFKAEFAASHRYSIDAFLARRTEYMAIGKLAIARVLLRLEVDSDDRMHDEGTEDHWYRYLVNALAYCPWEEFDPSWLKIVTFNYDRSLEVFLSTALAACYGKTEQEVVDRLRGMSIHHVYGRLGSPWEGDEDFLRFRVGASRNRDEILEAVRQAAARIHIIREGDDDDPRLIPIQNDIREAMSVGFLGFAYDETNVRRLGAPRTLLNPRSPNAFKPVSGTVLNLTDLEVHRIRTRLFAGAKSEHGVIQYSRDNFNSINKKCELFLRETLLVG